MCTKLIFDWLINWFSLTFFRPPKKIKIKLHAVEEINKYIFIFLNNKEENSVSIKGTTQKFFRTQVVCQCLTPYVFILISKFSFLYSLNKQLKPGILLFICYNLWKSFSFTNALSKYWAWHFYFCLFIWKHKYSNIKTFFHKLDLGRYFTLYWMTS